MKVNPATKSEDGSESRIIMLEHENDTLIVARKRVYFYQGRDQGGLDSWRIKIVDGILVVDGSGPVMVKR